MATDKMHELKPVSEKNVGNYIDLARFIAIYAVVLGHFPPFQGGGNLVGREIIYLFHVPIFFIVSGFLSKPSSIIKVFCSLIIPYFIYNVISIVKMDFVALFTVNALELSNAPTWFFAALFLIKIIADRINRGIPYYIVAIIALASMLYYLDIQIPRLFCLHAVIYGLPFSLLGKWLKNGIHLLLRPLTGTFFCVGSILFSVYVVMTYERFDLYSATIHNPIVYFISSSLSGLSILIVCHAVFKLLPEKLHSFIKISSRGSMFIVGTHYIIVALIAKTLGYVGIPSTFLVKTLIVCLLMVPYFYLIKFTFDRFPILYGKFGRRLK